MFVARLALELIGFGLRYRVQEFLAQQTDLGDHTRFHFIQRATAGD